MGYKSFKKQSFKKQSFDNNYFSNSLGIGQFAEQQAADHLKKSGYVILARNFRTKMGEIDIIAKSPRNEVVFIEVKYRSRDDYGGSIHALSIKQQQRIRNSALLWLQQYDSEDQYQCRFDVMALTSIASIQANQTIDIHWLEGAF